MNTLPTRPVLTRYLPATLALMPVSLLLGCNSPSSSETTGATTTTSTTVAQANAAEPASTREATSSEATSSEATTSEAVTTSETVATSRTVASSKATQAPARAKAKAGAKAGAKPKAAQSTVGPSVYRVNDEVPPGAPADVAQAMSSTKVPPPPMTVVPATVRVRLVTSKGPIVLALNGKAAPNHVRSFTYLSRRGFYNGTIFHRYADLLEGSGQKGPIIQGGDPLSRNPQTAAYAGTGGPGYQVPRERNNLKHDKLVIAAARSSDPDSAGSQFYITQAPVYFLDEGDGYTVFGKVVEGASNALKLAQGDKIVRAEVLK
ncbi:MAG: peptidyl-prolyl cis-trans isomerase [Abditibacteriota bacterium]|nr:peptidyl-prolyl cis-trans isomerase [Abditibacteriota bacterium]